MTIRRRRCISCNKLTEKWNRYNGGQWFCFDGCHSTTGWDKRTIDGQPAWKPHNGLGAWDPKRMMADILANASRGAKVAAS